MTRRGETLGQAGDTGVVLVGPRPGGEDDASTALSPQSGRDRPPGSVQMETLHGGDDTPSPPDLIASLGMQVLVHRDKPHLAAGAARRIADVVAETGAGRVSLGLAGGSTPEDAYHALRDVTVDWERVDAWLSDERWVPHDHEDSNGGMAARALMDHVPATFHRPRWAPWLTASDSAAHYEAVLRSLHPDGRSHLILLGMGDDGHTASLFPGTAALDAPEHRWYVANHVPRLDTDRLTATYPFLRAAHRVMVLVAGTAKAPALRRVLEPGGDERPPPAAGVMGGEAEVTWLVDEEAAADLVSTRVETVD